MIAVATWLVAGGQMPSLLHALGVHVDAGADFEAFPGQLRSRQLSRPAARANPLSRLASFAVGGAHERVAAKPDHVVEAEFAQEFHQPHVGEAAIGEDRYAHALGQRFLQPGQAKVLEFVAPARESAVTPNQWLRR